MFIACLILFIPLIAILFILFNYVGWDGYAVYIIGSIIAGALCFIFEYIINQSDKEETSSQKTKEN